MSTLSGMHMRPCAYSMCVRGAVLTLLKEATGKKSKSQIVLLTYLLNHFSLTLSGEHPFDVSSKIKKIEYIQRRDRPHMAAARHIRDIAMQHFRCVRRVRSRTFCRETWTQLDGRATSMCPVQISQLIEATKIQGQSYFVSTKSATCRVCL